MRSIVPSLVMVLLVLSVGIADAQLIVENFDSQTTGSPPAWLWWNNGSSGTILIDETVFHGSSGKSVELFRTTFDDIGFGFGRNFPPIDGPAELTFFFRVGSTTEEYLTAVGGNNSGHQVAWWVGVGGDVGAAIGTHSETGGWNHVMNVVVDTWYGVTLDTFPSTHTYDIKVWEDGNPGNTATQTGIPFRNGSAVEVIDQIQFGNFSDVDTGPAASAYIDGVALTGARVLHDDFETGNTGHWSWSTRPRTIVTSCYQTVTTDAVLANDLTCDSGVHESVGIELGASNIYLDLGGHTISGHPSGIGVRAMTLEGVTIKNGTITEHGVGMDIVDTAVATVRDIYIKDLVEDDPDWFRMGTRITRSRDVLLRDCFIEFLPVAHKEANVSADSEVVLDNIEVKNSSVGLNVSGNGDPGSNGTDGTVINSRFFGVSIAGILVQWTDNSLVSDNEFYQCETSIGGDGSTPDAVTGLVIEDNSMNGGFIGVHFEGTRDSDILDNVISDHWRGIFLDYSGCAASGDPGCFYATDNIVSGNTATGSYEDLYHHELVTGNTWINNTCQTKVGDEIPPCIAP